MKDGISVWIFSKIVMLIFLFLVFATVISFMKILSEKTSADAAEALATQITYAIHTTITSITLSSDLLIPLPETIPEREAGLIPGETRLKNYNISINSIYAQQFDANIVSVSVGWTPTPTYYTASSSFITPVDVPPITLNSVNHRFLKISKSGQTITLCACRSATRCDTNECVSS